MRSLFGVESQAGIVESYVKIDPSRSPFIKERFAVIYEGESLQDLLKQIATLQVTGETFKVSLFGLSVSKSHIVTPLHLTHVWQEQLRISLFLIQGE